MRITMAPHVYHTYLENDELLVENVASSNVDFHFHITCVTLCVCYIMLFSSSSLQWRFLQQCSTAVTNCAVVH